MKTYSTVEPKLIEYIGSGKWRVRWDIQVEEKEEGLEYVYSEYEFKHKPTIQEIKEVILADYNKQIDLKILSGFTWKDMEVWLSSENQFNYKAAYDLAVQTSGGNLPITFKFGSTLPVYYEFTTLEELTDFYTSALNYINDTLNEGWKSKDSIDFGQYV